jgi:hypothetical protein
MTSNQKRNQKRREARAQGVGVAEGFRTVNTGPRITGSGNVTVVKHKEYVADLTSTGAGYQVSSFRINAGIPTTFPWLYNLAANFEKYKFRKLHFVYHSSVATTTSGSVMLAIDLDALDSAPATKAQMLQMNKVVRSNVWEGCRSEVPQSVGQLFIRTGAVPAGADAKTYDVGSLFVALSGVDAGVAGEVWFEYEVELHTPQSTQAAVFSAEANWNASDWLTFSKSGYLGVSQQGASIVINAPAGYEMLLFFETDLDTEGFVPQFTPISERVVTAGGSKYVYYRCPPQPQLVFAVSPLSVATRRLVVTPFGQV